jgi:hypothetical protein
MDKTSHVCCSIALLQQFVPGVTKNRTGCRMSAIDILPGQPQFLLLLFFVEDAKATVGPEISDCAGSWLHPARCQV